MKNAGEGFKARLRSGSLSLATLWTLRLPTGAVLRFTENTTSIYFENEHYEVAPYIQISAIRDSIGDGYSDATIDVSLQDDLVSEGMIRYRELKDATFKIELVFFDALELGSMEVFAGTIGDSEINNIDQAKLSVQGGIGNSSSIVVGEVYSERCRNVFGDFRCGVDTRKYEAPFVVTGVDPATGEFFMSITADEASDQNPELSDIVEQSYGPGSWRVTIPAGTTSLSVVLGGAGGGGARPPNEAGPGGPGSDAGPTWFGANGGGSPVAYGGKGGVAGREPVDGSGEGGTVLQGQGAAGGDSQAGGRGGAGGRVLRTYPVGPNETYKAGDQVLIQVAAPGNVNQTPTIGGQLGATIGEPGFIIVYTRGEIATVDGGFNFGRITWSEGDNANRTHNIKSIIDGRVTLNYNLFRPIKIGDRGVFTPGCSNYRTMCIEKYNNLPNMRAEPDVPQRQAVAPTQSATVPPSADTGGMSMPFGAAPLRS